MINPQNSKCFFNYSCDITHIAVFLSKQGHSNRNVFFTVEWLTVTQRSIAFRRINYLSHTFKLTQNLSSFK